MHPVSEHPLRAGPRSNVARRVIGVLGVALLVLTMATDATADSFRCGRKLVRTGDSPETLRQRCGEPQGRDFGEEELRLQGNVQKVRVERWYYKPSSRQLQNIVLIYRGEIVAIRTGDR